MFGSETLEVAIGLAVLFSFMSLFASAARETIEAWYQDRGLLIHKAMAELFSADGDESSPSLAQFYNSIAISPLFRGAYNGVKGKLPSYITSGNFANTILDMARKEAKVAPGVPIADWIDKLGDTRISQLVRLAFDSSGKDPEKTRVFLEAWFNSQMDRVAGWYKRSTHVILLIIGFLSAVALNVDAVAITKHLYRNDAVREVIVAHAQSKPPAALGSNSTQVTPSAPADESRAMVNQVGELRDYGFPIGWSWQSQWPTPDPQCALDTGVTPGTPCALDTMGFSAILLMIFGWVVTAFGISLGAPFWFDILNKFMVVRSTVKPDEKSPPEASKDAIPSSPPTVAPLPLSAAPPSPPPPPPSPEPSPPPPQPPQPAPAQPDVRPAR
jgi:hypothetical protein